MDMKIALGFLFILQNGGALSLPLMMLIIFAIFYVLVIRPQQKKQRQVLADREQLLNSLKPGDKVITSGGIYGTIVAVRENSVQLRIAQSVSIEIQRAAIAGPQSAEGKEPAV
ncbi:MAG TPA: preprotein translocase subunit YajC [Blastocatellia bacterium]|jgi:preprotein translocase subunit YajC|nr:preprotein translocase subunit YajC [Blastocatellia bacterium]